MAVEVIMRWYLKAATEKEWVGPITNVADGTPATGVTIQVCLQTKVPDPTKYIAADVRDGNVGFLVGVNTVNAFKRGQVADVYVKFHDDFNDVVKRIGEIYFS